MNPSADQQKNKMSAEYSTEIPNEMIEQQTKKIPNLFFLTLGFVSMAGSLALALKQKKEAANFVGQWVPTLLIFGLYNKLVKVEDELLRMRMH